MNKFKKSAKYAVYKIIVLLIIMCVYLNSKAQKLVVYPSPTSIADPLRIMNPILKGYYADPSIIYDKGAYYIYATKDPWGGKDLAVLETADFVHFTTHKINWPTKEACTSPTSNINMVWAPSVVRGENGKFYMYVSVGSEIWAGISDSPLGPWHNMKKDQTPLISRNYIPGYHMIDAEVFIDDDGQAYLYWGSGLNWINGACFVVKLGKNMHTFIGQPKNITPPHYFEAPFMLKKDGIYYLMYSNGKAIDDTYNVRYSEGITPFGPWIEGKNSPILSTTTDSSVIGPGHNTVFKRNGQYYILYHKIFPQNKKYVLRQLCIDSLNFDSHQNIEKVRHNGVIF